MSNRIGFYISTIHHIGIILFDLLLGFGFISGINNSKGYSSILGYMISFPL